MTANFRIVAQADIQREQEFRRNKKRKGRILGACVMLYVCLAIIWPYLLLLLLLLPIIFFALVWRDKRQIEEQNARVKAWVDQKIRDGSLPQRTDQAEK